MHQNLWGQYEMIKCIGEGSEGKVYLVWDKNIDRFLAIKEIDFDSDYKRYCYERQVQMLKRFGGQYVPMLIQAFIEENVGYIITEYVEGETLKELIERTNGLQVQEAFDILQKIARTLELFHYGEIPVVHGDIKAENVIIGKDNELKLIDLGGSANAGEKRTINCNGTYGYAPTEQRELHIPAKTWWDIYALNKLFHYMLTGNNPSVPPYTTPAILDFNITLPKSWNDSILKYCDESVCSKTDIREYMEQMKAYKSREMKYILSEFIIKSVWAILCASGTVVVYINIWGKTVNEIIDNFEKIYLGFILFIIAFIFRKVCIEKIFKNRQRYRRERNIWKSAKKGIYIFLLFIMINGLNSQAKNNEERTLPIILYNDERQTICLKEDSLLKASKNILLEIPIEKYVQGEVITLEISCEWQDKKEKRKILFLREKP